jgi:hypothetical protein
MYMSVLVSFANTSFEIESLDGLGMYEAGEYYG